jgi:hypothetical protein
MAAGLGAIASVSLIVLTHLNDTYHIDHVAGAWLTLAKYAGSGVVYPPLYDGVHFGGTRYMPLQFLAYGVVGRIAGDYVAAPKALSALIFAVLLLILYRIIRSGGCSRGTTLALLASVAVSFPGLFAASSTYGDALAVLWQLAAVALVTRSTRPAVLAAAAGLCTLALLTKFSAVWAAAAIFLWVVYRQPRRALIFAFEYVALAAASVWLLDLVSGGRMLVNLHEFAASGLSNDGSPILSAPRKLYEIVRQRAIVELFVLPLAVAAIVAGLVDRRPSIPALGWALALPLLLVILADEGTDFNHALDIIVLTAVCAGEFVARARSHRHGPKMFVALSFLIITGVFASYRTNVLAETRAAAATVLGGQRDSRFDRRLMNGYVGPDDTLLSEDASVPLLLGRTPIILDAFMLRRMSDSHPTWRADLVDRLERHQFDKIVLIFRLDLADPWFRDAHFGTQIASAMDCNYRLANEVLGGVFKYRIYVPRRDPAGGRCPAAMHDGAR